ncbi:MAG: cysteine desulfurase [Alphaproteobacteria bacterium]
MPDTAPITQTDAAHPAPPYDLARVRSDFPILSQSIHGKPLVYLDNAASAMKPRAVIDAMRNAMEQQYSNVHRGIHTLSQGTTEAYEACRETVRAFLNAAREEEIVFTRGGTEAINLVAQSWGRTHLQAGDAVLISAAEHHANIVPWQMLVKEKGISLKVCPLNSDGSIDLGAFTTLLTPDVKLVAITAMSNALGVISPVEELAALAHQNGSKILFDGCQYAVHGVVDVQAIDADFFVFAPHKLYGPTGIGVLYGKYDLLDAMPPWQGGGDMIETVSFDGSTYQPPPLRFEAGTPSILEGIGLKAAIDYVTALGREDIARHEHDLTAYAQARLLAEVPGITIHGTAAEKSSVISFSLAGGHPQDIGTLLDKMGIAVRTGHHCAEPLMSLLDLPSGTCRASFGLYNTYEEADALVDALKTVREFL